MELRYGPFLFPLWYSAIAHGFLSLGPLLASHFLWSYLAVVYIHHLDGAISEPIWCKSSLFDTQCVCPRVFKRSGKPFLHPVAVPFTCAYYFTVCKIFWHSIVCGLTYFIIYGHFFHCNIIDCAYHPPMHTIVSGHFAYGIGYWLCTLINLLYVCGPFSDYFYFSTECTVHTNL